MASARAYREKRPRRRILEELQNCSGSQFDPEVVNRFLDLCRSGRIAESEG
jgi:response regulator RpfG family c-di-GMP phosphodiesterase